MYQPPSTFARTPRERADQLASWQRSDQAFFAAGACHILAFAFLAAFPEAGFAPVALWADDAEFPHHVYVTDGEWAFDHAGWTRQAELLATVGDQYRPQPIDVDLDTFCVRHNHRGRHQFAADPWERAQRYLVAHAHPWPCHDRRMAELEVVVGDIIREDVDAIVNAANESLRGGGGVDGAIHRAAGPRLAQAGAALAPCSPGDAKATPAFDLDPPIHHVIHTVGPRWHGGGRGEAEVLASCYRRCLEVADELGARSVAFPAISTGIFGYPTDQAARVAVATLRSARTAVRRIRLVAFDERSAAVLRSALAG